MLAFGESFYLYYYCLDGRKFVKHSVGGCWEVRDPKLPRFFLFTKTTELLNNQTFTFLFLLKKNSQNPEPTVSSPKMEKALNNQLPKWSRV